MEKAQEMMKRGSSSGRVIFPTKKHMKQSALNGDVGVSERSKKDKDRGSRVNLSSQMGGGWSEGEGEDYEGLPLSSPPRNKNSTKKFKLQSKSFKGSNVIAPANVPRRLRSAMNKRTQESLSPPLHHTSTGMVQSRINNGKKPKGNMVTIPMITKDEEEVAEALFSLARMSPNNESNAEEQTSEEKRSVLQETIISPALSAEAPKDKNILSQHASSAIEAIDISSSLEGSAAEAEKRSSLSESIGTDRSNAAGYPKLDLSLQSSMSLEDRAKISQPSTIAHSNDIPSHAASMMGVSAQFSHGIGSVQLANPESSLREQMLENGPRPVVNALRKEVQHSINGKKEQPTLRAHGPSLSPGMSMEASRVSEVHVPSSSIRSFPTKTPAWLDSAASATRPGSSKANVSTEKVHPVLVERRQPRKRCVSHAYISHLIQAYQTAEKTPVPPTPLKPNEETKFGAPITNNLSELRNGPNRFVCMGSVNNPKGYVAIDSNSSSVQGKAVNDVQVGTKQGKMLQHDHLSSITSGTLSDKQKYDFLSLSTGGDGSSEPVATTANKNQGGMGMESSSQAHSPYLHPFLQHHPPMPYSLPHVRYPFSQQLQLSQYATSPMYCPPHPGHAGLSKLQQQQQQHQMWAAHQAAVQYRPGGMAGSPFPKWQNGRYESPSLLSCSKPSYPSSSLDVLGMKFSPGPQQQNIFSLPPSSSRGKRQHHYISSSFNEGSSGVLHSESSPQLQLVCNNEHL